MEENRRRRNLGALATRWEDLQVVWKLMRDPGVNAGLKLIPALAAIYLISPIDLLPDVMLGLGQLDDIAIVLLAISTFIRLAPPASVARARGDFSGESEWVEGEGGRIDGEW